MIVNTEQIQRGITSYVENEIASKATGLKKFGVYFMLPSIQKTVADYTKTLKKILPDMFDDSGNVDLDRLYNLSKTAIQKSGQIEFMGIIFNEYDIDSMYSYIKSTSDIR
jgi:hypothetical protein